MNDLNLYSVNWQDGMLISQQHLTDQERYFENLIQWHAAPAGDSFGLISKGPAAQSTLELSVSVSGNRLRVELGRCQGLTPGGHYIEISSSNRNTVFAEAAVVDGPVPVYVSVADGAKQQVGNADPGEEVPRVPYRVTSYALHLGEAPSMSEDLYFQVAELIGEAGDVRVSDTFYAPCLTLAADNGLGAKAVDLRNRLENLLSLSSRAYTAITSAGALSEESSSLQIAFKETMYQFAIHLASILDDFVTGHNGRHPIHMVITFKKLFRVFTTLLNLQPGLKDYLNERYFAKELGSEVGKFMSSVDSFLLSRYNHRNISGQVQTIDNIAGTLRGILGFLAQLKREQLGDQAVATDSLTYNGKTYHNVDYGACIVEQAGELSYVIMETASSVGVSDTTILMSKDMFSVAEWNNMQVRIGLNEARGLGETDPVEIDTTTYGDKVALHPQDMLKSAGVNKVTLIFRGARDAEKFSNLTKSDLILYVI